MKRVYSLLDNNTNQWDTQKIWSVFDGRVAVSILKVDLGCSRQSDKWIWTTERSGNFSVKSAYHLLQNCREEGESSTASHQKSIWKHIWKIKTPQKIKLFSWRVCHNVIPTQHTWKRSRWLQKTSALSTTKEIRLPHMRYRSARTLDKGGSYIYRVLYRCNITRAFQMKLLSSQKKVMGRI